MVDEGVTVGWYRVGQYDFGDVLDGQQTAKLGEGSGRRGLFGGCVLGSVGGIAFGLGLIAACFVLE